MLSATSRGSRPPYKETKGVFGRVGFREDEKKKIEEGKLFGVFVWEGGERKKMVGPGTHQKVFFPKWGVN